MPLEVRRARDDELPQIGDLTARVYVESGFVPADDPYLDYLRDAQGRAGDSDIWVAAEPGGPILGTVAFCPAGSSSRELAGDGEGEFRALVVAPEAQGRGVGEALVRRCLELSRAAGDSGMVLSTLAEMTAAHRLYERLGFVRDPAADWSPVPDMRLLAYRLRF